MEEKNVNKLNEFDGCCCGPEKPEPPKPRPNHCQEGCCEPKEIDPHYMDIKHARCVPILTERIYDCINIESGGMKYVNLEFEITSDARQYKAGDEICIKKVAVKYDFIGLINDANSATTVGPLPVIVDNVNGSMNGAVPFIPAPCSPTFTCGKMGPSYTLYNTYVQSVETIQTDLEEWCCNKGRKSKLAVVDAEFYVCNLRIYVYGKIGCEDFEAELKHPYSGPLSGLGLGTNAGLKSLDFLGTMCYPAGLACLNMELKFRSKLGFDCIRANEKYSPFMWGPGKSEEPTDKSSWPKPCFEASALASLCVKLQVYSTIKEELVVYTTPHGLICGDSQHHDYCNHDDHDDHCKH
ncbi:MAG: hypothetical protein ACRC92_17205 [Peptostreptococcaceae bacterium]